MQIAMNERSTNLFPVDTLGGLIKARCAAGDKAIEKAEDHYKAAGLHLLEAKEMISRTRFMTWTYFLSKYCSIGRSRADELIAIADGLTTLAELRAKGRERAARHAAKNKSARASVTNGQAASPDPLSEQRNIIALAMHDMDLAKMTLLASYVTWLADLSEKAIRAETALADRRVSVAESEARLRKSEAGYIQSQPTTDPKPATKRSPASLKARRKSIADNKMFNEYCKQFGGIRNLILTPVSPDVLRRMESSLKSGVDDLADMKAELEREEAECIRGKS
jgi:hypothetical protein